ncbi:MAG TPA: hypothetical protein VHM88_11840 [Candidatus Acidoferrales bacterium]|jgi:hypothetical protein|nr:hypothetical protein [Candidatus Dormibacteraeota bacterium]HEX2712893.1 hypothetical protein [Candidatus Acidoferrales bacterium]
MREASSPEVHAKMLRGEVLTLQELSQIIERVGTMNEVDFRVLSAQADMLTLNLLNANIAAIQSFDKSSAKLTTRIYVLTIALVFLTVVLAVFTGLLWWKA